MRHDFKAGIRSLHEGLNHARTRYWHARHFDALNRARDAAFAAYRNHSPCGLHIGAAECPLENWFNTDLEPHTAGVYYLDATLPFPFPDHCFDFVFSEHMIEHIPFKYGLHMLAECKRVLKPGGVVRIATPNLRNIIGLITSPTPETNRYLDWSLEKFQLPTGQYPKAPIVINTFFHSWGHQFLYDPETLTQAMTQSGFHDIIQERPGTSSRPFLRGVERHDKLVGELVNEFETMVLEGLAD